MLCKIRRAGSKHAPDFAHPQHVKRTVRQIRDTNGNVDAFFDQVDYPVKQEKSDSEFGILPQQFDHNGLDMQASEHDRSGHRERAARRGAAPPDSIEGRVDLGHACTAPLQKHRAFISQPHTACRASQELHTNSRFQCRNCPGDSRR